MAVLGDTTQPATIVQASSGENRVYQACVRIKFDAPCPKTCRTTLTLQRSVAAIQPTEISYLLFVNVVQLKFLCKSKTTTKLLIPRKCELLKVS